MGLDESGAASSVAGSWSPQNLCHPGRQPALAVLIMVKYKTAEGLAQKEACALPLQSLS